MQNKVLKKVLVWSLLLSSVLSLPSFAYAFMGYFIASPLTFVPASEFNSTQRSNMSSCASIWNTGAGETIFSRSSSTHNITDDGYNGYGDGSNYVYFLEDGEEHLALCYYKYDNGVYLEEFDIVMNKSFWNNSTSDYDFYSVFLHELGHAAGLDHSSNANAVMYPTIGAGVTRRTLNYDDTAGMHDLYYWNW